MKFIFFHFFVKLKQDYVAYLCYFIWKLTLATPYQIFKVQWDGQRPLDPMPATATGSTTTTTVQAFFWKLVVSSKCSLF